MIDGWDTCFEIALRRISLDLTDDKSTLIQVMAWCRQATSRYQSQCWPRSLLSYDVTRPEWVKYCTLRWCFIITPYFVWLDLCIECDILNSVFFLLSSNPIWVACFLTHKSCHLLTSNNTARWSNLRQLAVTFGKQRLWKHRVQHLVETVVIGRKKEM